ncbi:putative AlkP superfamily pyrophosphatase or phosphodiesterase [Neolewinella xylanilytica]|uniref:Putative AlkP superfamily pyrophosphatase or phosphodiesterase n=1 Tax=Neolewinella xylanilytica TaxID=1514080 RepID=A0A2S6I6M5_9BACT|nr:ectonucleotide pyrophosphatase/phosphodiesterase [Neolewinella xylanilytica]PPK87162.1 putative AlkP superfamily pyrophosphatase or phosphodiesterase [Neolewinella xylanilytica]
MKLPLKTLLTLAVALLCGTAIAQQQQVILISIDGFRPDFYLDEAWPAPILQHMAENGAHAQAVKGVFPSVTYPSHTTIISGATPAEHGIYYNAPFEPDGATGRWYWEYDSIQTPTLFSLNREAGLTSAAISWPVTVGAPIDYNIPEVWSLDENEERLAPIRTNATPAGFLEEIETHATGKITSTNFGNDGYFAREQRFAAAASYIYETYNPDLLAVHLISVDHFQHTDGREGYMPKRAVSAVDAAIGQILETVERLGKLETTTFIITGDHGFVDIHSTLAPNVLLKENDLIGEEGAAWTAKFHTSGAAAFLHLNDPEDTESVDRVRQLLSELPESQQQLFRIVERDELATVGADPHAVLAIAPEEGISLSSRVDGPLLGAGSGGTHGFFPEHANIHTGFIAYGGKAEERTVLKQMNLTDIAPVIAEILGFSFTDAQGILYPGILRAEAGK